MGLELCVPCRDEGQEPMKKICERCGDAEWPCFLVDALCRMCQALRRDERRASREKL
jgi:hypothetical protein